jgi:DNA-directed RNA polymerase specialized sigma24 family protein
VFLRVAKGAYGYEEIVAACEVTRAAVRSRLYRARIALRAALERPTARSHVLVRENHG